MKMLLPSGDLLPPRMAIRSRSWEAHVPAKPGREVFPPALPDDDFEWAVRVAQAEFDRHHPDVVVGASKGVGNPLA
jgi:hypothetical protein